MSVDQDRAPQTTLRVQRLPYGGTLVSAGDMHSLLSAEQTRELAYLLGTGVLAYEGLTAQEIIGGQRGGE
jgi:hypothetical protein